MLNAWAALGDEPHPTSEGACELGDGVERALAGRCRQRGFVASAEKGRICLHPSPPSSEESRAQRLSPRSLPPQTKKANVGWPLVSFAHPGRFELPTLGFVVRCSIQLSYGCVGGECIARDFGTDRRKCDDLEWAGGGTCVPGLKR